MKHDHAAHRHHKGPDVITNMPHQHAFTIVGDTALFAIHMTQYHHEEHKYQLVMKVVLPPEVKSKLNSARGRFPSDTFMLCNAADDLFMVPDLPSRRVLYPQVWKFA
ncbi:hypothetical protein JSE7799_00591 [Jannaschia seosinensis]|uniref:Uncharacterized protein n=1 Tax=Jannaschia seosinensis TaxID=313367 RepID=A0A0M7B5D0_9RHOB|nr:hypothetical protein [Jannaschia seosinensis]CUH22254.1 hypothetical protein JSE7799_00591 [Jannaschia seosinensis]